MSLFAKLSRLSLLRFAVIGALGLPVDAGRIGAYGPNVTVLRDFVRSSRQPL